MKLATWLDAEAGAGVGLAVGSGVGVAVGSEVAVGVGVAVGAGAAGAGAGGAGAGVELITHSGGNTAETSVACEIVAPPRLLKQARFEVAVALKAFEPRVIEALFSVNAVSGEFRKAELPTDVTEPGSVSVERVALTNALLPIVASELPSDRLVKLTPRKAEVPIETTESGMVKAVRPV